MSSKNFMAYDDAVNVLTEYASDIKGKTDKVTSAINGDLAGLDANGNLTDSGVLASDILVKSSTAGFVKNDGTIDTNSYATTTQLADKADKVANATANDFATLDSNGNLIDSGINKNIVPNTATSSNKLATNNDLPTELNDLSDDVTITSPTNGQILKYNATSGKWENQTEQPPVSGATFKGSILFANIPTTGMENGDWYDIKDAFTTDSRFEEGAGIECTAGTDIIWVTDDSKWNILTPSGVNSFNGRVGAVVPASGDYDASDIDYDNTTSGLTATDVQDAIDEVNTNVNGKANKVSGATNSDLAGLDSNGNLTDSGILASNVVTKSATVGLLKNDGTIDTNSYATDSTAYLTSDTTETTLADDDNIPFYDTSATAKKKSTWANIKSVLKTYFDTTYSNKISSPTDGNFVCVDSSGAIYSSNFSWLDLGGQYGLSEQTINYDWDLGYDVDKQMEIIISEVIKYQALDADEPGAMNTKYPIQSTYRVSQTVTLSTSADTSVMFGGQNYGFDSPYSQTYLIAPSSGKRDKVSIITTSLNDISYKSCSIDTTNHTCTVVFPPYSSAASMDVEIFLY